MGVNEGQPLDGIRQYAAHAIGCEGGWDGEALGRGRKKQGELTGASAWLVRYTAVRSWPQKGEAVRSTHHDVGNRLIWLATQG